MLPDRLSKGEEVSFMFLMKLRACPSDGLLADDPVASPSGRLDLLAPQTPLLFIFSRAKEKDENGIPVPWSTWKSILVILFIGRIL